MTWPPDSTKQQPADRAGATRNGYNCPTMNPLAALRAKPGLLGRLIRFFSSIWLGVCLLAVIILYSSIGSAVPVFRQYFELTEFEYFNHWFFTILIALFCVALTVATVVRIPFNRVNLGVITVHTGLLLLAGGSVLYFGRKIEGDVLLYNPRVEVIAAKRVQAGDPNAVVGQLVAAPGRSWEATMPGLGGRYHVEVDSVAHSGLQTASEVKLRVESPGEQPLRTVTLRTDSPQARFASLSDDIILRLSPTNTVDRFFDSNTPVLLMRRGASEPVELTLKGLPLYRERFVAAPEMITDSDGRQVASQRLETFPGVDQWKLPLQVGEPAQIEGWPFRMEVDGYLPYAVLQRLPAPGGDTLNPIINIEANTDGHTHADTLFALVPRDSRTAIPGELSIEFRWLEKGRKLSDEWTRTIKGQHVLDVWVKDKDIRAQFDVKRGQNIKIDGTDYDVTIEELQSDWPLATAGFEQARTPVARVLVKTPSQSYHRSVLQRFSELNQDRDDEGKKLSDTGLVDDNLELRYTDASAPSVLIAAGPDMSPVAIITAEGGKRSMQVITPNVPLKIDDKTSITLRDFIERPRFVERPVVIPLEQRRPQPGRQMSLIRLHLTSTKSDWQARVWVPFESYNDMFADAAPRWTSVVVPEIGQVEFLYGRMPRILPGRVALEQMHVDFYPGRNRPSEWISYIRFEDPKTRQIRAGKAYLNHTARIGPWTLFQSGEAPDHESYTILGVGNRDGVITMLLGCTLVTLGLAYAFYVKPVIKRRMKQRVADELRAKAGRPAGESSDHRTLSPATASLVALAVLLSPLTARAADSEKLPAAPAAELRAIQSQLKLDPLRTLMVQHNSQYQTLEAWARDVVTSIHGKEEMLGLDPVVAAFELMFNRAAYDETPLIYIKDLALRKHITSHPVQVAPAEANRIIKTGLVSSNYLNDPSVGTILSDVSGRTMMRRAIDRYSTARFYYDNIIGSWNIIPSPVGRYDAPWHTIDRLWGNLEQDASHPATAGQPTVPGVSSDVARKVLQDLSGFAKAWLARDVDGINKFAAHLSDELPLLAPPGTYPTLPQRKLEVVYHRLNALTVGWAFYVAALFASIWALISGVRWIRVMALSLFILAFSLHGAGLAMRWYIVSRIPVANMFESVVASAWLGTAIALVLELVTKRGVFMLAGSFLGFLSLVLGKAVGSQITQIAPILDDVMLRIHTVLIIASYSMITLAFGVAVCYLVVSARGPRPIVARATLGAVASVGLCAWLGVNDHFHALTEISDRFIVILPIVFGLAGALLFVYLPNLLPRPAFSAQLAGPPGSAAIVASAPVGVAAPPRENTALLEALDQSHMILLQMATIALFVGLVLGAVWADYSWGRPWGWDPKEVFALVTWLFYAILIHVRYVVRRRALWTAVLSCVGFAAMQFNWWVVNFYIVGLHSYA